ncbi:MAG: hypothetical protein ACRD1X_21860 [Vicinamibacteria bacterium]
MRPAAKGALAELPRERFGPVSEWAGGCVSDAEHQCRKKGEEAELISSMVCGSLFVRACSEVLMPTNPFTYLGVLVVAASTSIWIGAELTRRFEWVVPWAGGLGIFLLLIGLAQDARARRRSVITVHQESGGQEKR